MNSASLKKVAVAIALAAGVLGVAPAWAADAAARVVLVTGKAEAIVAGAVPRALINSSEVYPGDEIVTYANSYLNLKFTDEGRVLLRPNSRFKISEYAYPQTRAGADVVLRQQDVASSGRTVLQLIRGGFRALTGLVASANRDNYRVTSTVATIGIRGTDFVAFMCDPGSCDGLTADGQVLPAEGMTVGVESGAIFLETPQGKFEVNEKQFGFVGPDGSFFILAQPPAVLGANPVPDPKDCD